MFKKILFTICGLLLLTGIGTAYAVQTGLSGVNQHTFQPYTRHHDVPMGATTLGPTAPAVVKTGTAICLGFDADAEEVGISVEIPAEWDGASNMTFNIEWHAQSGDVIANGETVKWDAEWRSIADGEAIDNGALASGTVTFTGGTSETDKETYKSSITIAYTGGNQPLTVNDWLVLRFDRDVGGDSYSGDAVVCKVELEYTANKLATH